MNLLQTLLSQQKEVLGLNRYMSGDTSGAVRTAQESQILFQKANARMRVETDVFSYNVLLPLITAFYSFNRELALAADNPILLDDIPKDKNPAGNSNVQSAPVSPGLFSDEEIIISEILSTDTDNLTPLNALQAIARWKKALSGR